ncbi:MAG TPA: NAD(+)/NADH kinase [Atribacteraceae bacterium]|nr:NAD(+)/NADH kinase [Atribacteraceae bacterium]
MDRRSIKLKKIGLIVNPASGKDIRRLVAQGAVFGNREKINYLLRILRGLDGILYSPVAVVYMPDPYGLVEVARDEGRHWLKHLVFHACPMTVFGDEQDTLTFTEYAVREQGVELILVVGGDGTNRLVAKKSGTTPLFPVSAGTNNVFADTIEPTVVGMAAAYYLTGQMKGNGVLQRQKILRIEKDDMLQDAALVDAVLLSTRERGARAVWDVAPIRLVAVTHTDPLKIGLSTLVGRVADVPASEKRGAFVRLGKTGKRVSVPIAPGLLQTVYVGEFGYLDIGERIALDGEMGIIALDGEREVLVRRNERWSIVLDDSGPVKANISEIMKAGELGRLPQSGLVPV